MASRKSKKKKGCSPCEVARVLSVALNVCDLVTDDKKCDDIYEKLIEDKMSPKEAIMKIKQLAKGHKQELKALQYIERRLKI